MSEEEKAAAPEPDAPAPAAAGGEEDNAPEEENQAHFEPVVSSGNKLKMSLFQISSSLRRSS